MNERLVLRHDFNVPKNEDGYYEVTLPSWLALRPGDPVLVRDDSDDTVSVEGRVRCLIAVVEAYREDADAE